MTTTATAQAIEIRLPAELTECGDCHGDGTTFEECPECGGWTDDEADCNECHGYGEVEEPCWSCDGMGDKDEPAQFAEFKARRIEDQLEALDQADGDHRA